MNCTCCEKCKTEKERERAEAEETLRRLIEEKPTTGYYTAPLHSCPYYPYAWGGILPPPCLICGGGRPVTTGITWHGTQDAWAGGPNAADYSPLSVVRIEIDPDLEVEFRSTRGSRV